MGGYIDTYAEVRSGTVLVTRGDWTEESFAARSAALAEGVVLIHLAGDETLESLDEDAMRAVGWVRA